MDTDENWHADIYQSALVYDIAEESKPPVLTIKMFKESLNWTSTMEPSNESVNIITIINYWVRRENTPMPLFRMLPQECLQRLKKEDNQRFIVEFSVYQKICSSKTFFYEEKKILDYRNKIRNREQNRFRNIQINGGWVNIKTNQQIIRFQCYVWN